MKPPRLSTSNAVVRWTPLAVARAYRSQPSIDPKRMQEWVPGVKWGAPALGCSFEESLKSRDKLLPVIEAWSPDYLLHKGADANSSKVARSSSLPASK